MLGHSRDDWQQIAQRLADARLTTLAIDLPGAVPPGDSETLAGWSGDVRAAINFLASRAETKPGAIGVLGASLGASLGTIAAAADPQVRSLLLVSPVTDYRGLRIEAALREFGARPAYLIASRQDSFSARSSRDLAKNPSGPREVRISDVAGNGTALLTRDPDLVTAVIEWFQRTLG